MIEKNVEITRQDFDTWQENPVTKKVFEEINKTRTYHLFSLLNGAPAQNGMNHLVNIGQIIGRINAYDDLLEISFSQLDTEDYVQQEGN